MSQNKEIETMLVFHTKPLGIELYFYANTFFCFSKPIWLVVTGMKTLYKVSNRTYKEVEKAKEKIPIRQSSIDVH